MNEFDINAPIEQQFTRDGRKVLSIFNSGLDIKYPLTAFVEGDTGGEAITIEGKFWSDGTSSNGDIITRKPDIKTYQTMYIDSDGQLCGFNYDDLDKAMRGKDDRTCRFIVEITVNPQTLESTAKTVWKKTEN